MTAGATHPGHDRVVHHGARPAVEGLGQVTRFARCRTERNVIRNRIRIGDGLAGQRRIGRPDCVAGSAVVGDTRVIHLPERKTAWVDDGGTVMTKRAVLCRRDMGIASRFAHRIGTVVATRTRRTGFRIGRDPDGLVGKQGRTPGDGLLVARVAGGVFRDRDMVGRLSNRLAAIVTTCAGWPLVGRGGEDTGSGVVEGGDGQECADGMADIARGRRVRMRRRGALALGVEPVMAHIAGTRRDHHVRELRTTESRGVVADITLLRDRNMVGARGQRAHLVVLDVTKIAVARRALEHRVLVTGLATHDFVRTAQGKQGGVVVEARDRGLRQRQLGGKHAHQGQQADQQPPAQPCHPMNAQCSSHSRSHHGRPRPFVPASANASLKPDRGDHNMLLRRVPAFSFTVFQLLVM